MRHLSHVNVFFFAYATLPSISNAPTDHPFVTQVDISHERLRFPLISTSDMMTTTTSFPKAVLFDLFHTLVCSPPAGGEFGLPMGEALGIPHLHREFMRRF